MDQEYKPIISEEERAARRRQRAESRRRKRHARRMRQLRRLVPCLLLVVLAVGLVTAGAGLVHRPEPEVRKAGRPLPTASPADLTPERTYPLARVHRGHGPAGRARSPAAAPCWSIWIPGPP